MDTDTNINSLVLGYLKEHAFNRAASMFEEECKFLKKIDMSGYKNGKEQLMPKLPSIIREYCAMKRAESELLQKGHSVVINNLWQQFDALTTQLKFLTMGKQKKAVIPNRRSTSHQNYKRVLATVSPQLHRNPGQVKPPNTVDIESNQLAEVSMTDESAHQKEAPKNSLVNSAPNEMKTKQQSNDKLSVPLNCDDVTESNLTKSPKRKRIRPKKINSNEVSKRQTLTSNQILEQQNLGDQRAETVVLCTKSQEEVSANQSITFPEELNAIFDALLTSKNLQEKIADNINKVVNISHLHSPDVQGFKDYDTTHQTINVEEVLNMTRSDPSFDSLFSVLDDLEISPSAIQTPMKALDESFPIPLCSDFEPIRDGGLSSEHAQNQMAGESLINGLRPQLTSEIAKGHEDSFTKLHDLRDQNDDKCITNEGDFVGSTIIAKATGNFLGDAVEHSSGDRPGSCQNVQSHPICDVYIKRRRSRSKRSKYSKNTPKTENNVHGNVEEHIVASSAGGGEKERQGDIWAEVFPHLQQKELVFSSMVESHVPSETDNKQTSRHKNLLPKGDNEIYCAVDTDNTKALQEINGRTTKLKVDYEKHPLSDNTFNVANSEEASSTVAIGDALKNQMPNASQLDMDSPCESISGVKTNDHEAEERTENVCGNAMNEQSHDYETAPVLSPSRSLCDNTEWEMTEQTSEKYDANLPGDNVYNKDGASKSPVTNIFDKLDHSSRRTGFSVRFDLSQPEPTQIDKRVAETRSEALDVLDSINNSQPKRSILKHKSGRLGTGKEITNDLGQVSMAVTFDRPNNGNLTDTDRTIVFSCGDVKYKPNETYGKREVNHNDASLDGLLSKVTSNEVMSEITPYETNSLGQNDGHCGRLTQEIKSLETMNNNDTQKKLEMTAEYRTVPDDTTNSGLTKGDELNLSKTPYMRQSHLDNRVEHTVDELRKIQKRKKGRKSSDQSSSQHCRKTRSNSLKNKSSHEVSKKRGENAENGPSCEAASYLHKEKELTDIQSRGNKKVMSVESLHTSRSIGIAMHKNASEGTHSESNLSKDVEHLPISNEALNSDHDTLLETEVKTNLQDCEIFTEGFVNVDVILEQTSDGTLAFIKPVGANENEGESQTYLVIQELQDRSIFSAADEPECLTYGNKGSPLETSGDIRNVGKQRVTEKAYNEGENVSKIENVRIAECKEKEGNIKTSENGKGPRNEGNEENEPILAKRHDINESLAVAASILEGNFCNTSQIQDGDSLPKPTEKCSDNKANSSLKSASEVSDSGNPVMNSRKNGCFESVGGISTQTPTLNVGPLANAYQEDHAASVRKTRREGFCLIPERIEGCRQNTSLTNDIKALASQPKEKPGQRDLKPEGIRGDDSLDGLGFKITSSEVMSDISEKSGENQDNFAIYLSDDSADSPNNRDLTSSIGHQYQGGPSQTNQEYKQDTNVRKSKNIREESPVSTLPKTSNEKRQEQQCIASQESFPSNKHKHDNSPEPTRNLSTKDESKIKENKVLSTTSFLLRENDTSCCSEDAIESCEENCNGSKEMERVLGLKSEAECEDRSKVETISRNVKLKKSRKRKSNGQNVKYRKRHQMENSKTSLKLDSLKNLDVDNFLSKLKYSN